MPRARAFILDAMASLAQQLAFVPAERARRQLECVRTLIESIHADDLYGWSDIEYRITQFRSEKRSKQAELKVVGASLARDLNELALRLSARAPQSAADAMSLIQLAKSWKVSERTLYRWRAAGLLCCWVQRTAGRAGSHALILGVRKPDAAAFRLAHAARVARASAFSLIDAPTRQQILARAAQVGSAGERRISTAARTIAAEVGRSRESVRALLKANPSASHGKLVGRTQRDKRASTIALAAWGRGINVAQIAQRLHCSRASAARLVAQARGAYLRSVAKAFLPESVEIPATFWRTDAREVLLAPTAVHAALLSAAPIVDGQSWLAMKPPAVTLAEASRADSARMMAVRFLLWSAQHAVVSLAQDRPTECALDQIDTDLRWARLILRTLFVGAMPTIVTRLKVWSGVDPLHLSRDDLARQLELAGQTLVEVVLASDPVQIAEHRIRLGRALSLAFDRRLMSLAAPKRDPRTAETTGGSRREPLDAVRPWQHSAHAIARRVARLNPSPEQALWQQRLGWDGTAPQTLAQIASGQHKPVGVVARLLNRALNSAIERA
ncbi:MAG: hypothetical protein EXS17_07540 [Phycisphaerales bacterium]|nr:hypothetical protein [Phycisphaerales bacterium]